MPMQPLIRRVPPQGVPGQAFRPTMGADGRTVYIGDSITDANADSPIVVQWDKDTQAAGRVPVRMPSGILKGQLASRAEVYDSVKGWDYQLAPFTVRVADNATAAQATLLIAEGDIAAALESASKAAAGAIPKALAWLTGIPKPVLYVGGALLLVVLVKNAAPRLRSNPPRYLWIQRPAPRKRRRGGRRGKR